MASRRNQKRYSNQSAIVDSSFERSIGSLTSAVQTLTDTMKKTPKTPGSTGGNGGGKSGGGNKEEQAAAKKRKAAWEDFNDTLGSGGKNMLKGIEGVFGKKAMKSFQGKMFEGFQGGKGVGGAGKSLLSGGLKGMGGSFAGLAGSAMKALGPIGAVFSATKAIYDFLNSGEAAKAAAKFGAIFNVDTSGSTRALFESSEEYRKIITDYNYMLPLKLQQAQQRDSLDYQKGIETDALSYSQSLIKDKYEYEIGLIRDSITFAQDQASQQLDADLARRKALYVSDMGYMQKALHIGERALQAIGSSTQAVLEAVKNVGVSLGTSLQNQVSMATSAAGLGAMYMSSADEVLGMSKTFRLMDKSSAKQALNMTAGLKSFAKMNDMEPAQLFKEMADSQEEIFKYTNYTSQEFAAQVVMLKNMNTSMSSMAKASDTMVLNYKDSMKAEMSLSSMLGKNVDLSETRARLMSGDMAGGASALKTALGGMDINSMNPFAKQQLSQATGMGIDELMNLMSGKGGGAKGSLEQENAKKTGAAIAQGALNQDISNAAAKLALDQKNRAQLLVFEQIQRKGMLAIEQTQRLENLALEQKWRLKYGKLESEQAIDSAVRQMQAEARATSITAMGDEMATRMQEISGTNGISGVDLAAFKDNITKQQGEVSKFVQTGQMSTKDMEGLAKYQADMAKYQYNMSQEGVKINPADLPKLQNYLGGESAYKTKVATTNVKVAEGNLQGAKDNRKEKEIGVFGHIGNFFSDVFSGKMTNPIGMATGKTAMGMVNNEVVKAVENNAQKELDAANAQLKEVTSLKTTQTQGSAFLAKQNNAMLGILSTSLLYQQATAEAAEKPITINGKALNKSLLNQNSTSYGLGPTPGLFNVK